MAINNFTIYKIFNVYIGVFSDSYRHHTTNNFKWLIEKESLEIIFIITTLIFTIIILHIGPTKFLEAGMPEIIFYTNAKILEELVIVEKICAKLIFSRCVSLNYGDHCKPKVASNANYKHNIIEMEKKNLKAKFKQLKNKK